ASPRPFPVARGRTAAVGGTALSSVPPRPLPAQTTADTRGSVSQSVAGVLRPELVRGTRLQVNRHVSARLLGELRRNRSLVTVKVWRPDGVLAWTNPAQQRLGQRFAVAGRPARGVNEPAAARPTPPPSPGR